MPNGTNDQNQSLFDQIQQMQNKLGTDHAIFTTDDKDNLDSYSLSSLAGNFQKEHVDLNTPDDIALKQTAERLGDLAARYPKNSPDLKALREYIPDIGKLRKEKMEALRADATRSGMDKVLNDFFGSKKRAAKAELKTLRDARTLIDSHVRPQVVKAPKKAGAGRNIFTAITNASAMGDHATRHNTDDNDFKKFGNHITYRTKSGLLDGVEIPPNKEPNGKYVLFFSGSGNPAEHVIDDVSESYIMNGATVITFNYRGFGNSKTLDSKGKQVGTPLSEQSMYEDGMEMYKFVRDVMGISPENITLHGYSLGGAVASHVAANIAEQNKLKAGDDPVPANKKLGGVVLQSPIGSMYEMAKDTTKSKVMAYFGEKGSGAFDTQKNMQRLYNNDPDIPVAYISGKQDNGDYLSLEITKLHKDPKAPFQNASVSFADCAHLEHGAMLEETAEHLVVAIDGRNAQLNTATIQRQMDDSVPQRTNSSPQI